MIDHAFSVRLREERKRKGFNQSEFAELGGVKKLSQLQYEKGERLPSLEYIAALWRSDKEIDVGYILTGKRSTDQRRMERAVWRVLYAIQDWLSLIPHDKELHDVVELAFEEEAMEDRGTRAYHAARALLSKSPNVILNSSDLEQVVDRVEFVLASKEQDIPPRVKARLLFQIYHAYKTAGDTLDWKTIEDAVSQISR